MVLLMLAGSLALLLLGGCSPNRENSPEQTSSTTAALPGQQMAGKGGLAVGDAAARRGARKPVLLFFLNPHGRPCQMQRDLLAAAPEISRRSTLKLVQTTVAGDRDLFYRYGIRSLPCLVLADADGAVLHRFAPGVHRGDEVLQVLEDAGGE